MQIIEQKKFVAEALNLDKEILIVHIVFLSLSLKISIYPAWKTQIVLLITEQVIILAKYLGYANVFSKKSVVELSK